MPIAGLSRPIRQRVFERLEGQFDCQANGTLPNQSLGKFAATRVSLNFRGGGWDPLRYWEIPATGASAKPSPAPGTSTCSASTPTAPEPSSCSKPSGDEPKAMPRHRSPEGWPSPSFSLSLN